MVGVVVIHFGGVSLVLMCYLSLRMVTEFWYGYGGNYFVLLPLFISALVYHNGSLAVLLNVKAYTYSVTLGKCGGPA